MTEEEINWVVILKRLAAISGKNVPELLNCYWECETDYVNNIKPLTGAELDSELVVPSCQTSDSLVKH